MQKPACSQFLFPHFSTFPYTAVRSSAQKTDCSDQLHRSCAKQTCPMLYGSRNSWGQCFWGIWSLLHECTSFPKGFFLFNYFCPHWRVEDKKFYSPRFSDFTESGDLLSRLLQIWSLFLPLVTCVFAIACTFRSTESTIVGTVGLQHCKPQQHAGKNEEA